MPSLPARRNLPAPRCMRCFLYRHATMEHFSLQLAVRTVASHGKAAELAVYIPSSMRPGIAPLTSLRFFAAMVVVIFHYNLTRAIVPVPVTDFGYEAVTFLFCPLRIHSGVCPWRPSRRIEYRTERIFCRQIGEDLSGVLRRIPPCCFAIYRRRHFGSSRGAPCRACSCDGTILDSAVRVILESSCVVALERDVFLSAVSSAVDHNPACQPRNVFGDFCGARFGSGTGAECHSDG